ncbi:MAG: PucR family transcriptional regulator [Tissierella sp.]|uniref:PucR family transcriptional regulator n=1 Tax=Tissierella sp. TaxID=41274 RepID=UPI003F987EE4
MTIYKKNRAYVRLISVDKDFKEVDIISLERAIEAVAIVILKKMGEEEIEKKYKNDFLNDVINGEFKSKETLIERGAFFNIDLNGSYLLFLLSIDSFDYIFSKEFGERKLQTHNILSDLFNVVFNSFFSKSEESIIWSMNKNIFILYPVLKENVNDKNFVKNLSENVAQNIKKKVDKHINEFTISVGVGRFYEDVLNINKSYKEAQESLRIGKLVWGDNNIYHYDDIETYNILMRSGSKEELKGFVQEKLGKLIEHDKKRNSELLDTLEEILNSDGNLRTTAEKMFLHYKTVSYRRDQIEEILGISLNDMEEKFSIYMALKIKQLIQDTI